MNGSPDPLSELRDIHLPDPVSWWPPAPGWWIAVGIGFGLLAAAGIGFGLERWLGSSNGTAWMIALFLTPAAMQTGVLLLCRGAGWRLRRVSRSSPRVELAPVGVESTAEPYDT